MKTNKLVNLSREEFLFHVRQNSEHLEDLIRFAIGEDSKAWRAAWLLKHAHSKVDFELDSYVSKICKAIPERPSNQRRELLGLLCKVDLSTENEGYIFDAALSTWENIDGQPSSRIVALKLMLEIISTHPQLINDIQPLLESHYLENLSPGIRNSAEKLLKNTFFDTV